MKSKLTIMPNPQAQTYTQTQKTTKDLILSYCCNFEICPKCAAEGHMVEHIDPHVEHKPFMIFFQRDYVSYTGRCRECDTLWKEEAKIPNSIHIRKLSIKNKDVSHDYNYWKRMDKLNLAVWILIAVIGCLLCLFGLSHSEEGSIVFYLCIFGICVSIAVAVCSWFDACL